MVQSHANAGGSAAFSTTAQYSCGTQTSEAVIEGRRPVLAVHQQINGTVHSNFP